MEFSIILLEIKLIGKMYLSMRRLYSAEHLLYHLVYTLLNSHVRCIGPPQTDLVKD